MKLTSKINLLFTTIVSGILLVMVVIVYNNTRDKVRADFRLRLLGRARNSANLYKTFRDDTASLYKSLGASLPGTLINKTIDIYNNGNKLVYEFHDINTIPFYPDTTWLNSSREDDITYYRDGEKDVLLYRQSKDSGFTVVVAAEDITGRDYLNSLKRIFFIYVPLAIVVTLIAGYLFSRRLVRPIRQTISDVNQITSQNLSQRLQTGNDKDELAELNNTFNHLLNRLEESFSIQKRFIANASHEMSTPLTSVSSQVEVALLHERSSEEYNRVLQSVLEDVKGLHQLTRNLLEIAKAGNQGDIELNPLRIDEVVVRTHSEVMKQNPSFHVELDFPDLPENENECIVFGNPHLLHIAFKNIMENGCKYSPDKRVCVCFVFGEKNVELIFTNKSDSITSEEIEQLFEPFYRRSNTNKEDGFGLGLTLTRRIIGLHKGTIEVINNAEKEMIVFKILLPVLGN